MGGTSLLTLSSGGAATTTAACVVSSSLLNKKSLVSGRVVNINNGITQHRHRHPRRRRRLRPLSVEAVATPPRSTSRYTLTTDDFSSAPLGPFEGLRSKRTATVPYFGDDETNPGKEPRTFISPFEQTPS